MKQNELKEHYDVATALAGRGQEVYDVGDFSVILEDVKASRVEGTRSLYANSDLEYHGYNDVSYTFIALIYHDIDCVCISTDEETMTNQDQNELESKIMEEKRDNEC